MAVELTTSEKACLNFRVSLGNVDGTPAGRADNHGMVNALKSDMNREGFEIIGEIGTKGRPVNSDVPVQLEVEYELPNCEAATSTASTLCDTGVAQGDLDGYIRPTVDRVKSVTKRLTLEQFDKLCREPSEYFARMARRMAKTINDGMNADLIELAYATMGNYEGGVDSKVTPFSIPLLNPKGFAQRQAYTKVKKEFRKQKSDSMPIVVGGEILGDAALTAVLGGTGAESRNADPNLKIIDDFYDTQLDATLQAVAADTNSHLLSWTKGALQLLEWYQYKGNYEMSKEDYTTTTIVIDGMKYDYSIKFSECGFYWDISLMKHYGLFYFPDAVYTPCYTGNNKLHFLGTCAEFDCTNY